MKIGTIFLELLRGMMEKPCLLKKRIFDESEIAIAIQDVADNIIFSFKKANLSDLVLIGIQPRGVPIAERLKRIIEASTGVSIELGVLDISMYRDDIGMRKSLSTIHETTIPFDINGRTIILVDDVLHTGRTIRAALDAITDYGRPTYIKLAVLIDRRMREFPIRADYTGLSCEVSEASRVAVSWVEIDGIDAAFEMDKK